MGTHLEVKSDQREDKRLQVLDEVVEDAESFWILRLVDIHEGSYLCGLGLV